jgi:hypothetical protein
MGPKPAWRVWGWHCTMGWMLGGGGHGHVNRIVINTPNIMRIMATYTKNILYRFMEGQTHFSTSWHAKMSLTLHEPI